MISSHNLVSRFQRENNRVWKVLARHENVQHTFQTLIFRTLKFQTINFGQKGEFETKTVRYGVKNIGQNNFGNLSEIRASPNFDMSEIFGF